MSTDGEDMPGLPADTRFLVVDDGAAIRALMQAYLRRLGYEDVDLAANVKEGLALFRERGHDVVFLDLTVGGENGNEFAEQAFAERPEVSIVLMTAHPSTHPDVVALVALGARDYLPKPIQIHRLSGVIEHVAEDREARADEEPYDRPAAIDASYG